MVQRDGTCIIEKVDSKENNSDIGTKPVPKHTFDYLTHNLIDRSLRLNLNTKHTRINYTQKILRSN